MNDPTKNQILKKVEQKFRLGEVVLVVNSRNLIFLILMRLLKSDNNNTSSTL